MENNNTNIQTATLESAKVRTSPIIWASLVIAVLSIFLSVVFYMTNTELITKMDELEMKYTSLEAMVDSTVMMVDSMLVASNDSQEVQFDMIFDTYSVGYDNYETELTTTTSDLSGSYLVVYSYHEKTTGFMGTDMMLVTGGRGNNILYDYGKPNYTINIIGTIKLD